MYSLNDVALHEGHTGWRILRAGTNTQGGFTKQLNKVPVPGRPGYRPAPGQHADQMIVFNVRTPRERLDELLALCYQATKLTYTDDPSKEAQVRVASSIPDSQAPFDKTQDVTLAISIYDGVWRDGSLSTFGPTSITSPVQTFEMMPDISAPIYDMDIFIRGVFGQFELVDSAGSWLKTTRAWPGASNKGLLYIGATQQAFVAMESNPWVPVSDASSYIDVSGNGGFRLTPQLVSGNPADRQVSLELTTLTQTSTSLRVRAKRAYWTSPWNPIIVGTGYGSGGYGEGGYGG